MRVRVRMFESYTGLEFFICQVREIERRSKGPSPCGFVNNVTFVSQKLIFPEKWPFEYFDEICKHEAFFEKCF